jgi:hypothetical protein
MWNYEDAYNNLMLKMVVISSGDYKANQDNRRPLSCIIYGCSNNGPVSLPIGAAGNSVLIGNPYPSALDSDLFLDANAWRIGRTIYFGRTILLYD